MKLYFKIFGCIFLALLFQDLRSQTLEFVENKGQWHENVLFKSDLGGSAFFLQKNGYRVLLNNKEDLREVAETISGHLHDASPSSAKLKPESAKRKTVRSFAYEVSFEGANPNPQIVPEKPIQTSNNYFIGNDPSKWVSNASIYTAVVYKDVYPGIDVRYYTDRGFLKYDLIVHPGASLKNVALKFKGVSALGLKKGDLTVKTTVGEVVEKSPYSFQIIGNAKAEVMANYVLKGDVVRIEADNYAKDKTLIVDPTLVFASFTGSLADNWGYTATYDGTGNFYAGGIVFGTGYPVSTGAFDQTFNGGAFDIGIIKLSPNGSERLYATYIGGEGEEQPHSLIVDYDGNLVIGGRTSSGDFPTTGPNYGPGGGWDIFIAKLSADGKTLMASRKFGGKADDGVNIATKEKIGIDITSINRNYGDDARSEVIVDKSNNIYLASCTQSADFPVTTGAFQTSFGGKQDGVVIKASSDLNTVGFTSFFGGSGDDACFVLSLNPADQSIYVGGSTTSNNLKGTGGNNGPILYSTFQGTGPQPCDGFVTRISNDGKSTVKTVYVGSTGNVMLYGIQFDKKGFPYITGTTNVAMPVLNAAFNSQAQGKQYITKLQPDLSGVVYSTNFGKGQANPDISITAFLVDRCENVYVAGWGGGIDKSYPNATTNGLTTTPDAIRSTTDGSDFYFFVLEKNALSQLYGTFYGNIDQPQNGQGVVGDHVDGGTSRFDQEGVIYEAICANCGKAGVFPTTPGVWGPDNASITGSQCNEAMVKIAFQLAGVGSGIRSEINGVLRDTMGCVPLTVNFTDTIARAKTYVWNFGDGSDEVTTTVPNSSHTFEQVGTFRVRLISIDPESCNISDTSYLNIRVRDDESVVKMSYTKLPPCEELKYEFKNLSVAPANKPFQANSFVWDFGDGTTLVTNDETVVHSFPASGSYHIALRMVDTNYCNYPDSAFVDLRIAANVVAQFETPDVGCAPYTAVFDNTSLAGVAFFWDFGDGTTSTEEYPTHMYLKPGTYTIKLTVTDENTCNKTDNTEKTILVSDKPQTAFTYSPTVPKENTPYNFTNFSNGAVLYKWIFGDGDSLVTTKKDTVVSHLYNASGTFNVCLIATNQFGCEDTVCQPVDVIIVPLVDVPNAFTPNGDGVNDVINVKAFGIQTMDWKIFNRWGKQVYQGSNAKIGWDGRVNGQLQPQDVYVYVLDVTFTDGTKYRKKGDITLLR